MPIEHEDLTSVHRGGYVGNSDPGAVGAYIFWTDTTTTPHILKVRNAGNTAWVQVGYTPAGTNVGASGEGVYKQFAAGQLEFKKIKSTDGSVTITSDASQIDLAVEVGDITISNLDGNLPSSRISMLTPAALVGKPTVGAGAAVEITLGSGLEFDGTTLKVSASAGTVNLTGDQSVDGIKTFTSSPIVPTPSGNTAAVNKTYVDSAIDNAISSLQWKSPVRVATVANGSIAGDFENGDTVDGVVLATGDRILIKNQIDEEVNGIYTVQASGSPVRATDADTGPELENATVLVLEGTVNAGKTFSCNNTSTIILGSTELTFVEIALGAGVVDGDKGDIVVSSTGTVWTIEDGAVTLAKIADASANSKLVGSGTAGSGNPYTEITLGTLLSMSGTTLNVTAVDTANSPATGEWAKFTDADTIEGRTTSELFSDIGITASVAELNILDGVTASASELNALDGITATVTELNYTDGVTSAIQTQLDAKALATPLVNPQTGTTYTLDATDNGKIVTCSNAGAITVTVPSGLGVGFHCQVVQIGAGQVSFTTSGATLNNRQSHTKIAGQYGVVTVESYATNVFVLAGDTAA